MSNVKIIYIFGSILYITAIGERGTLHPDGTGIYTRKKLVKYYININF